MGRGDRGCIRQLFAHLRTDADATLHVVADAQTLTRPSKVVNCA